MEASTCASNRIQNYGGIERALRSAILCSMTATFVSEPDRLFRWDWPHSENAASDSAAIWILHRENKTGWS